MSVSVMVTVSWSTCDSALCCVVMFLHRCHCYEFSVINLFHSLCLCHCGSFNSLRQISCFSVCTGLVSWKAVHFCKCFLMNCFTIVLLHSRTSFSIDSRDSCAAALKKSFTDNLHAVISDTAVVSQMYTLQQTSTVHTIVCSAQSIHLAHCGWVALLSMASQHINKLSHIDYTLSATSAFIALVGHYP